MRTRNEIVAQYVDELLMLQRFYQTGDDKELVAYMQQRRSLLINIYYRRYHHKTDISLLYDAAVERTLARLKMPDTIIRDVSGALLSTMRTIRHERKGNQVFNERVM